MARNYQIAMLHLSITILLTIFNSVNSQNITPVIYVSGGISNTDGCLQSVNKVHIFDLTSKHWCFGKSMPQERAYHGTVYFQDKINFIGGATYYSGCNYYVWDSSFAFIPSQNSFGNAPSLNQPMNRVNAFAIGGKVFALGNVDDKIGNNYSIVTTSFDGKIWSTEVLRMTPRKDFAAVSWKDTVWSLGGSQIPNGGSMTLVEIWNVTSGQWRAGPPMQTPRLDQGAAVINNTIYVCGGESGYYDNNTGSIVTFMVNTCESLTLNDDGTIKQNWTVIAPLPNSIEILHLVAFTGNLLAFGGNIIKPAQVMHEYDPTTGNWTVFTNDPDPKNMMDSAAVVIDLFPIDDMYCSNFTYTTTLSSSCDRFTSLKIFVFFTSLLCAIEIFYQF